MEKPLLILTLLINKEAFLFFNTLRQKHFPASRNFIDAHLTLFHALPNENTVIDAVKSLCMQQRSFELTIKEVVSIGRGVAYKIESSELMQLHKTLQNGWQGFLSAQDRQKLWPHITVQNKVPVQEAHQLKLSLEKSFTPFSMSARGLQLWDYLNGPWKLAEEFLFEKEA